MTTTKKHAGLAVKKIKLADAKPHPENPRIHPEKGSVEWDALRASLLAEYFDPLVWNKRNGCLVSGHYRRLILLDEGVRTADMVVVDWPEPVHKARMIAANELSGFFDDEKLAALVRDIKEGGIPAELTGMTEARIEEIIANAEAPAPPADFSAVDRNLPIQHVCPKCNFKWSGKPA